MTAAQPRNLHAQLAQHTHRHNCPLPPVTQLWYYQGASPPVWCRAPTNMPNSLHYNLQHLHVAGNVCPGGLLQRGGQSVTGMRRATVGAVRGVVVAGTAAREYGQALGARGCADTIHPTHTAPCRLCHPRNGSTFIALPPHTQSTLLYPLPAAAGRCGAGRWLVHHVPYSWAEGAQPCPAYRAHARGPLASACSTPLLI
jgi:hypothetical protein